MTAGSAERSLPETAHLRLVPLLLPIAKSFRAISALQLQSIGLEAGQDEMLLALGEDQDSQISRVADQLNVRPSTLSKMTDKLVSKGLVERARTIRDGRVTIIRLTEEGARKRAEVRRIHEKLTTDLADILGEEQGTETLQGLATMAKVLSSRLARRR